MARTERPFLRHHFPGYRSYIWLDADLWIQNANAITGAILVAEHGSLAMASQSDRSYLVNRSGVRRWKFQRLAFAFGDEEATRYIDTPGYNSGLIALGETLSVWDEWARVQQEFILRKVDEICEHPEYFSDQTLLNYVIWKYQVPINPLPAVFNWLCHRAKPRKSLQTGKWVEPFWPHRELLAIHLAGNTNRRMPELRFPRDRDRHFVPDSN